MLTPTLLQKLSEAVIEETFMQVSMSSSSAIPGFAQRDWLINWCKNYLQPSDKLFVCIHKTEQKQTVACYPLYLKRMTFGYELRFIGTGEPEHAEVCSEFQDFIIDPAYLQQSLILFTKQVTQLKHCARICFDNILAEATCYKWLKRYRAPGWKYREQCLGIRYLLPVATDELSQISQLPQSTLRRHARRFVERNDITIEYCKQRQDISYFFDDLIKLHTAHWQHRGKPGAFSSKRFRQFHLDFASSILKQGKLLLFKLNYENQTIAVFYGFYHHDTLFYYQSGITPASPLSNTGIGMHLVAMRNARLRGCKHYDLMKGKENSYKTDYVAATQPVYNTTSSHFFYSTLENLKGLLLKIGYKLSENIIKKTETSVLTTVDSEISPHIVYFVVSIILANYYNPIAALFHYTLIEKGS